MENLDSFWEQFEHCQNNFTSCKELYDVCVQECHSWGCIACCVSDFSEDSAECNVSLLQTLLVINMCQLVFGLAAVVLISLLQSGIIRSCMTTSLSAADRAILDALVVRDGKLLHYEVPMARWCVTRNDLQQFRRIVWYAIQEGQITPTDLDPFDPSNDRIGPCVHTVNAQFIKPVTAASGNASWALMLHPDGLPCDLFVTHGWNEGIFEFIDKVVNSWPRGAKHAYCCMFSNPQNFDISDLISSPKDSPFARALDCSSRMLAVPNHVSSIYSRLWCAYEAFLAYSGEKHITTALPSVPYFWLRVLRVFCVFLLGVASEAILDIQLARRGLFIEKSLTDIFHHVAYFGPGALTLLVFVLLKRCPESAVPQIIVIVNAFILGLIAEVVLCRAFVEECCIATDLGLVLAMLLLCCAFEADRLYAIQASLQAKQLMEGFSGHIQNSACSWPADRERILSEIAEAGCEKQVDQAVEQVIHMGMSTRYLRQVAERAGYLGNVLNWSMSALVYCWGTCMVAFPLWLNQHCSDDSCRALEAGLILLEGLLWPVVFFCQPLECRGFTAASLRMCLAYFLLIGLGNAEMIDSWAHAFMAFFIGPLVLAVSIAGPLCVARMPLLGPGLVRVLFGQTPCLMRDAGVASAVSVTTAGGENQTPTEPTSMEDVAVMAASEVDSVVSISPSVGVNHAQSELPSMEVLAHNTEHLKKASLESQSHTIGKISL